MNTHYEALEAAEMAGISYRQMDYWTTKGYVRTKTPNPGQGNHRKYTAREVRVLMVMADLVRVGLEPSQATQVARQIVTRGKGRLGGFTVEEAA